MNQVLYAFNVSQGNVKKAFCSRDILEVGRKVLNIRELVYRGLNLLIDLKNTSKTQMIILCQSKH